MADIDEMIVWVDTDLDNYTANGRQIATEEIVEIYRKIKKTVEAVKKEPDEAQRARLQLLVEKFKDLLPQNKKEDV